MDLDADQEEMLYSALRLIESDADTWRRWARGLYSEGERGAVDAAGLIVGCPGEDLESWISAWCRETLQRMGKGLAVTAGEEARDGV